MKEYTQPFTTPYYAELKRKGIHLPCFLTHIRTDAARIEKPKDARMFRMLFLTPRTDGCCGTIDTSSQTNLIMLNFPYILSKRRSEEGKRIRRQYKNDNGVPYQACKAYQLNQSGTCDCITTFTSDNNIIELTNNHHDMEEYHEHPTKEDLLEYFGQRIKIRKMTAKEAFRLMDVDDSDIEKICAYPFHSLAEGEEYIKSRQTEITRLERRLAELKAERKGAKWYINNVECSKEMLLQIKEIDKSIKEVRRDLSAVKKQFICKTALYKLAGNSIVVSCLYHIFRTMFILGQPENESARPIQKSLFDL